MKYFAKTIGVALLTTLAGAAQAGVVNIYWSDNGNVNRANPGGANQLNLAAGFTRVDDVEIDQGAGLAFWNNWIVSPIGGPPGPQPGAGEGIYRSNLVGAGQVQILGGPAVPATPTGFWSGMHGLSLDTAAQSVYFTRGVSYGNRPCPVGACGEVSRINYAGLNYAQLTGDTLGQTWFPHGIAVDVGGNTIYWGEPGVIGNPPNGAVNTMPLAGGPGAAILPHTNGQGRSIALDLSKNLLFFSAFDPQNPAMGGGIWVLDLLTGMLQQIVNNPVTGYPDIEVDPIAMRLYATDYANGQILSWDYMGMNQQLEIANLTNPFGLALELAAVPEPGSLALLGFGLAAVGFARRGKR